LKLDIDVINKTESVLFGYVLRDFMELESIHLFCNKIDESKLVGRKTYYKPPNWDLLQQDHLSFD